MQLAAVALLVLAAAVRAEDECAPKPGQKPIPAQECCKMDIIVPDSVKQVGKVCMEKFPMPSGAPPAPGAEPDATTINRLACMFECFLDENKMLTADKKLDKDAITKFFTSFVGEGMKPVVTAAIEKCVNVEVDPSLECKSGAAEFKHCFGRETFLNCPSTLWTSNGDCDGLKAQLTKCPKMPVIMVKSKAPPK